MDNSTKILIAVISLSVLCYAVYQLFFKETQVVNIVSETNTEVLEDTDLDKPILNNKEKGDLFETYIIERLVSIVGNEFIDKNSDYHTDTVSATANRNPDLRFKFKDINYSVECKFRSSFKNLTWAKDYQLAHYKKYQEQNNQKVLVALGIGDTPDSPKHLYFIPLDSLNKVELTYNDIKDYHVTNFIPLKVLLESKINSFNMK